ncbi:hypothetical protein KUTeg_003974 [Tegillarca granosa]|uniref:Uncharacterized protein n=1 Tax=Tegillarca granosa TaxID=220873 RepID=A0ABQ9FT59_TEGGR|nr:hypothetical protein KUTeg_003974 [Tegillarca granosa]
MVSVLRWRKYLRTRYSVERDISIEFENLMNDDNTVDEMSRKFILIFVFEMKRLNAKYHAFYTVAIFFIQIPAYNYNQIMSSFVNNSFLSFGLMCLCCENSSWNRIPLTILNYRFQKLTPPNINFFRSGLLRYNKLVINVYVDTRANVNKAIQYIKNFNKENENY